jgi:hypothetical protein
MGLVQNSGNRSKQNEMVVPVVPDYSSTSPPLGVTSAMIEPWPLQRRQGYSVKYRPSDLIDSHTPHDDDEGQPRPSISFGTRKKSGSRRTPSQRGHTASVMLAIVLGSE